MSNYLNHLVAKSFNLVDTVQPLMLSRFEPLPISAALAEETDGNGKQQASPAEETELEMRWEAWISKVLIYDQLGEWRSLATPTSDGAIIPQSTDLTPTPFADNEELPTSTPLLSEEADSEPYPSPTLSESNKLPLTPAIEAQTNLSFVNLGAEPTAQLAPESSENPPAIVIQTVDTVRSPEVVSSQPFPRQLPQPAVMPPTAPDRQFSTEAIAPEPNISLASPVLESRQQPQEETKTKPPIETHQVVSAPPSPDVVIQPSLTPPLQPAVIPLTVPDRQFSTEAIAPEPNISLASPVLESRQQPQEETKTKPPIETHQVVSAPPLPDVVIQPSLTPPLQPAVIPLTVPDRQFSTEAIAPESNISLASPVVESRQQPQEETKTKPTIETHQVVSVSPSPDVVMQPSLTPPLQSAVMPLTALDRQFSTEAIAPEPNISLVSPVVESRQQPATKFLENSQVQIKSAPEINTALSNSVPEPQLESAPELSGIQQHVVNRVVSSPQLLIVAPLAKQSFFETSDAARGSHLEQVHTVSTLNTPRGKLRDFSEELNGFEQIVPSETTGLADRLANTATGMIHPLTATPVAQPLESFASSDAPNSRIQESRTTHEQLSPSQYTGVIQRS